MISLKCGLKNKIKYQIVFNLEYPIYIGARSTAPILPITQISLNINLS